MELLKVTWLGLVLAALAAGSPALDCQQLLDDDDLVEYVPRLSPGKRSPELPGVAKLPHDGAISWEDGGKAWRKEKARLLRASEHDKKQAKRKTAAVAASKAKAEEAEDVLHEDGPSRRELVPYPVFVPQLIFPPQLLPRHWPPFLL